MRAFARYRFLLKENAELKDEILKLDKKVGEIFRYLFERIDELQKKQQLPHKRIGYKPDNI